MQPLHTDLEQCGIMKTVTPKVLVLYMVGRSLFMRWEEMYLHCATFFSFLSIAIIKYPDDSESKGGEFLWSQGYSPPM